MPDNPFDCRRQRGERRHDRVDVRGQQPIWNAMGVMVWNYRR
jgi:hypothetical protein